ncbi:MAG: HAD-IA family hydrolase [Gemmatimonadota bacterium]
MPLFSTVLFDLDGTLIDSLKLIIDSYHHTLREHRLPARDDAYWLRGVGTPLRVQFQDYAEDPALLERLVATYRNYNLANHDRMVTIYPGVAEMMKAVRAAGARTALVTSKNREGAIRGLRLTGLESFLDVLVCADDVARPKPDREPVDQALARLGSSAADAIFVGDSIHDIHSGHAAGVTTAAALWGPFSRDELAPSGPDFWLTRPGDLLPLLRAG